MTTMRWLAYLIAILFVLAGCSTAAAEPSVTITACPEDAVLVGTGDYADGQYTAYKCGPAFDDFNKPTPTPQVITETKEVEVFITQTPPTCLKALDEAESYISDLYDFTLAYMDEDWNTTDRLLATFDGHNENWGDLASQCRAMAESD